MNGRNRNITLIITLMGPVRMPPSLRDQIDYLFLFKDTNTQNRERLYMMYGSMFPSCDVFESAMVKYCDNHTVMVLNRNGFERVFWYRTDIESIKSFHICDRKYWECRENEMANNARIKRMEKLRSPSPVNIQIGTIIHKLDDMVL
jgi:hypothetical protein